ncbi:MAG: ferrochelatase [Actinobacteria bacterium]|nr:ferrochelatase [Actinomycetota bacterium]
MGPENPYDALLLVAFGGPEGRDQVGPFLDRVTAGRGVPPERLSEVAARYDTFGGVSPINGRMRSLAASVADELAARRHDLKVFWGNRNAPPLLADVVATMRDVGVERVLAWVASPYSSYSTCRQYGEDLDAACRAVGAGAPRIDRIRPHHDHPGLIEPAAARLSEALVGLPDDRREGAHLLFSAHSIPTSQAETCGYVAQLHDAARLIAARVDPDGRHPWEVVWQSRSGSPHHPWLEPDVGDRIASLAVEGVRAVAVSPLGMPIENFEIAWDLDIEAARRSEDAGVSFVRARAVDDDGRFASMVVDLFEERLAPSAARRSSGSLGLRPDTCPADCCPAPARP